MAATDTALEAELLNVAVEAARAAGAELLARWRRPIETGTKSTPTDPVSEADVAAEQAIRDVLARRRPGDSILGEEGGETPGRSEATQASARGAPIGGPGETHASARGATIGGPEENDHSFQDAIDNDSDYHYQLAREVRANLRWVVDPLDGTVNYLYGLPTFAVSVAVEDADGGIAAAVLDPVADEIFTASRGGAPLRNGEPIAPTMCETLGHALVGTGFGYEAEVRALQAMVVSRVLPLARDIRRAGAAALDMCACACGRLDAYYERGVKAWDIAAGTLMCERAGLVVRTLEPDGLLPSGVVVAAPALIDELMSLVAAS